MSVRYIISAISGLAMALTMAGTVPVLAAGDCSAAAARVVAQTGGQLLSVRPVSQGGRTVCNVTVLVPGKDNARRKKVTISVPQ